ncbi:hypothetical protein TPSD3_07390 [Thioflexithrix psekupsensis]|uniref:Glycosyltransferase 2-like domain-containing protein n=2 Tax=Thioflexithrix psekupsensis TaxID=1570016 RepID=A0A251X7X3_9GAMM|nr:hypothetical protein TPSD3_07390 [Thioflexithrix psekupsensis]
MQMVVTIVVLNWCHWTETVACLNSLRQLVCVYPVKWVICDNASSDDSFLQLTQWINAHFSPSDRAIYAEVLSENELDHGDHFPAVTLLPTGGNWGFAGGNNVGLRYALARMEAGYVWVLNNDTAVFPDSLQALLDCAETQPEVGLWGSTLVEWDAPQQVQCAGGCRYYPWLTITRPVWQGMSLAAAQQSVVIPRLDYVAGAALFFPVKVLREVGLLNDEYFLFYEELDYCQRLKSSGYTIAWCRDSVVRHRGSASVGHSANGNREQLKQANYYENLSTLKYSFNFHRSRFTVIFILRWVLKAAALIVTQRWFLLPPLWVAYRDFLARRDWRQEKK